MKVYVGYEENYHSLAVENGSVSDVTVFSTKEGAIDWAVEGAKQGVKDGFVIDREYVDTHHEDIKEKIVEDIENGLLDITMFRSHQENWDESYSIIVEEKEVL